MRKVREYENCNSFSDFFFFVVVDDTSSVRKILGRFLRGHDFHMLHEYDIVLMEVTMPVMDGI